MKKLIFTFLFIVLTHISSMSCTCAIMTLSEKRNSEFTSEIIVIADVLPSAKNSETYQLKAVEFLKGTVADSILTVKYLSSCSKFPDEGGRWIIYTRIRSDGFTEINQCGLSRSFKNPESIFLARYLTKNAKKAAKLARKDLQDEIDMLRAKRKRTQS
jgi:hypothetical protein